jgi:hypothetical protein
MTVLRKDLPNGRTAKRAPPTLLRSDMDALDREAYLKRIGRFVSVLSRVDPKMSAEGIRLLNPDLQHFSVSRRERGIAFQAGVNQEWRAWSIMDEHVPATEAPTNAGGLLKLMRGWKRDLALPSFRTWGGMRVDDDVIHGHALSIARLAAVLMPDEPNISTTVHPPTARTPGRIELKTDRKWEFDPVLEARLMKEVPVCAIVKQSDLYNDITFIEEGDGVSTHVRQSIDPMERLRLLASVADVKRPLRRL